MVQFSIALSNGVVGTTRKVNFHAFKFNYDGECQGTFHSTIPSCIAAPFSPSSSCIRSNPRNALTGSTKIRLLSDRKQGCRTFRLRHKEDGDNRMKLSSRLWAKPHLTSRKFRKLVVQSALNDIGVFMKKNMRRVVVATSVSVALGSCYLLFRLTSIPTPKIVPYSDLVTSLQAGSVTKVLFEEGSRRIYFNKRGHATSGTPTMEEGEVSPEKVQSDNVVDKGNMKGDEERSSVKAITLFKRNMQKPSQSPVWQFSTRKIDHDEKFLLTLMREKDTSYSSSPQSAMMSVRSIMITVLTLWIPLTPLMWLLYRQLNTANSPARKRRPDQQVDTFDDVEGVDSAKIELMEIVMCLQGSISYDKLGAKLPRGVLLIGPPGTGKTLLARAVAGEAGVPFFSVSASEFVELFVGRGAARIRDLFSVARKYSPSIVFIDELDAVGGKRGRSFNDERDQTLNQLLTEMDGFDSDSKVVVIAATNRPEALDSALCRPGRFSRKVLVGEPDEEGRRKILAVHMRGVPVDEDKQLMCSLVASLTQGFVGADLANVVNEAALLAARRGGETVCREDMVQAIERAKYGIIDGEKKSQQSPNVLSKELSRLFPWMPTLMTRKNWNEEQDPPMGYQTLS